MSREKIAELILYGLNDEDVSLSTNLHKLADFLIKNGVILKTDNTVEVIRCKDCRIGRGNTPKMGAGWIYCKNNDQYHKELHFCGYGERRGQIDV